MANHSDKRSPRDEENDPRKKTENENEDFPGYPHYPPKEDIMSASSDMKRVEVDVENLTPSGKYVNTKAGSNPMSSPPAATDATASTGDDDLKIVPGTKADVTKDDLAVLGGRTFSDDDLHGTKKRKMVTGDDLDIPGADLDNTNEAIGEEDEENNYYSLGGDRHEDLEEDRGG
ncbi:MAG TPA: hypothetical protein VD993_01845 [Chitinophagaceae bacterium]|nr:hypothetical protein [Chitinophagaceae bacterium]